MRNYKTAITEERHEEELRPFIPRSPRVSAKLLAKHPFERDAWTIR